VFFGGQSGQVLPAVASIGIGPCSENPGTTPGRGGGEGMWSAAVVARISFQPTWAVTCLKKVGTTLRGMVCGTCDNPYTMAALDDFSIEGDTLKFNILHEDWADGEIPTFFKHVTAHVGWNEMRATTAADHMPSPPPRPGVVPGFSLQGPVPIEATAGNVWPEWPPKGTSSPR